MHKYNPFLFVSLSVVGIGTFLIGTVTSVHAQTHTMPDPGSIPHTIHSVNSGNWSSASTWNLNRVPGEGDMVLISHGTNVIYDVDSPAILGTTDALDPLAGALHIVGTLKFSRNTNTHLNVRNNITIHDGGYLDMGVASDPIPATTTSAITFILTPEQSAAFKGGHGYVQTDVGLWVFEGGRWEVHGAPIKRTWTKLAADAAVGATEILVEHDVSDWNVGDTVVLSSTGTDSGNTPITAADVRTIVSSTMSGNNRRIVLNSPLSYTHQGTGEFRGEVALLSRNVVITTDLLDATGTVRPETTYINDVRPRKFAHTAYMKGARGNLEYVLFKHMGHYGKLGRYATHHHIMNDSSNGSIIRGTAGWANGFRCVNIHASQGITVEDNVCYRSSSTDYFMESSKMAANQCNPASTSTTTISCPSQDIAFIHNIAIGTLPKHFNDRNNSAIIGEPRRVGSFWPGQNTQHEAYLGNVVSGGNSTADQGGFSFPESGNGMYSFGTMPFTFVMNEVHSAGTHGIFSWQNTSAVRDMVATKLWRNGNGVRWGAYSAPFRYYNTYSKEERSNAFDITSVSPFIQDSIIEGFGLPGQTTRGVSIRGYVQAQTTMPTSWVVRNQFKDIAGVGITQAGKVVQNPEQIPDIECGQHDFPDSLDDGISLKLRPSFPAECSPVYIAQMGNRFTNVSQPLLFGNQPNPNSYWKIHDHVQDASPAASFVLVREDQHIPDRQGIVPSKFVNAQATYDPSFRGLRIPMDSITPSNIPITGLLNHRSANNPNHQNRTNDADFIFSTEKDYPPTIRITKKDLGNNRYEITAQAADDKGLDRVEFFVDWKLVETKTSAPFVTTVDLSNHPNKFAYIYARAFDGTRPFAPMASGTQGSNYEQRAYSNVFELGPEELGMGGTDSGPLQPGDVNGDGHVTITDISITLSHYGGAGIRDHGDVSGDGQVTIQDLSIILSHFGN